MRKSFYTYLKVSNASLSVPRHEVSINEKGLIAWPNDPNREIYKLTLSTLKKGCLICSDELIDPVFEFNFDQEEAS